MHAHKHKDIYVCFYVCVYVDMCILYLVLDMQTDF